MRYALCETEWKIIPPILPSKPRGVPRVDDRRRLLAIQGHVFINGMMPDSYRTIRAAFYSDLEPFRYKRELYARTGPGRAECELQIHNYPGTPHPAL